MISLKNLSLKGARPSLSGSSSQALEAGDDEI
jgi:hypothetical protein